MKEMNKERITRKNREVTFKKEFENEKSSIQRTKEQVCPQVEQHVSLEVGAEGK